jgi:hypothetical protein
VFLLAPVVGHPFLVVCSFWLSRLYDAMYPQHPVLGCRANLTDGPFAQESLPIVKDWLRHQLFVALCLKSSDFLTSVMITATLIFTLDTATAINYIYRAPCLIVRRDPIFSREGGTCIIQDLFEHLRGAEHQSIIRGFEFLRCGCSFNHSLIDVGIPYSQAPYSRASLR